MLTAWCNAGVSSEWLVSTPDHHKNVVFKNVIPEWGQGLVE